MIIICLVGCDIDRTEDDSRQPVPWRYPAPLRRSQVRHEMQMNVLAQSQPRVAMIGDSIFEYFETDGSSTWLTRMRPLGAVNLGIAGDSVRFAGRRIKHPTFERAKFAAVVILIGTNDLHPGMRSTPARVAESIEHLVEALEEAQSQAHMVVLGILPMQDPARQARISETNRLLTQRIQGACRTFIDASPLFRTPKGGRLHGLKADGQHLDADGYRRLADALDSRLRALLTPLDRTDLGCRR